MRTTLTIGKQKIRVLICDTFLSKMMGLMFRRGEHALLTFRQPVQHRIHGWFCAPLQLLYLDKGYRVVEIAHLAPFGSHKAMKPYSHLLELSQPIHASLGDRIQIKKI